MQTGRVKWFNASKGFGFIAPENGKKDVFVHYTGIAGPDDRYRELKEGQVVQFNVVAGKKGPQAVDVEVVSQE